MQNRPSQHPRIATLDSLVASRRRTRRLQAFGAAVGAGVLALFATGCPEPADLQNPETYQAPAVMADDPCEVDCVKKVFAENPTGCKICHNTMLTSGQLDLVSKGVTARLKDVASKHLEITPPATPGDCPTGDKLIDVANPSASWMLTKLKGTQKTCGGPMPTSPLGTSDMACMETYISCVAGKPLGGGAAGSSSGGAGAGGSAGAAAGTGGAAGGTGGTAAGSGGTAAGSGGTGGA